MDDWVKAGKIAGEARDFGKNLIKVGANVREILDQVDDFIKKKDAFPAFPSQIAINATAAHYCPDESDNLEVKENDLVKLDVGVSVNGAIGDTAITVDPSDAHQELVKASQEALENATEVLQIGTELREIGKTIQETIMSHGFSPIRNLGGHGLSEYDIHDEPHIPNYDNGNTQELEEDQTIAIEPFATDGEGYVNESSNATIFSLIEKKPVRLPMMREILNHIEKEYKTLPFTTRWLTKKFAAPKVNFTLKKLQEQDIINAFPPLIEKQKGMVSQAEHSFIIKDKVITTTKL